MTKLKYYFLVLILTFFACSSSAVQQAGPGDDESESSDTTQVSTLQPIRITLPEADFTDPKFIAQGKPSDAINGRLEGLINAAPKGASVYLSVYGFRDAFGLISAIRKANARGVKLHVMLDRSERSSNTPTADKIAAMGGDIDIVGIKNDASSSAINHNKFALFSNLMTKKAEVKNVVFTSSENWTPHSKKELQNAVILSHKGLYKAYHRYWQDMKSRATYGMANFKYREFSAPEDGVRALFYPKREGGKYYGPDTIVKILDNITDPSSATIQIEMPFWTNGRIAIVNKLSDLIDQGAQVEIVVRSNVPVYDALVNLANKGAYIKMYNYSDKPGVKKIEIHSKVMMIQGEWKGEKTNLIITGSHNYTANALKYNNENNIILNSNHFNYPKIFERYEANFNKMKMLPGICCTEHN